MTKRQQNIIILILGAIAALGPFSIDMYLPGFSAIAKDLNTDVASVGLTLTSYFIGISVGQLIYGPLVDRYGRKKPLLIGLSIYLVAALGCAFSPSIDWLIALRLILALGGCVGMVASRAIVRDIFPVNETARVFSTLLLVMGIAPIIAPTIGGYVTSAFGWKYIFIILSAISAVLILLVYRGLAETKEFDPTVSLKPGKVAKGYFEVFKNREFLTFSMAGSVTMAGMLTYITGSPFVLMEIYGFSETEFGWIFGLNAFGFIAGSQVNRAWLRKRSTESISNITAVILFLVGCVLTFTHFSNILNAPFLLTLLFLFLFFLGFLNPNTTALALEPFTKNAGVASALIGSLRMFSGAVASALISFFFDGTELPMIAIMMSCALIVLILTQYYKSKARA
ncbi:multidrug effflux MFS transporter [Owenweeksia hongkongensis]|uniref:multidrug effflux MFS transporter n=1 Tax=Owenweeksia hongkongensis TaxID=253245 RepID=UPI003A8E606B